MSLGDSRTFCELYWVEFALFHIGLKLALLRVHEGGYDCVRCRANFACLAWVASRRARQSQLALVSIHSVFMRRSGREPEQKFLPWPERVSWRRGQHAQQNWYRT